MAVHAHPVRWEIRHCTSLLEHHLPKPIYHVGFLRKLERKADDGDGLGIVSVELARTVPDGVWIRST